MWIFITVICLLALSMESTADRGTIDCDCSNVRSSNAIDIVVINVNAEANIVIEAYKMLVERKFSRHISRYTIEMFMIECDAKLAKARSKIQIEATALSRKNSFSPATNCGLVIKYTQAAITRMVRDVRTSMGLIYPKLDVLNEHDRKDFCGDIEQDISSKKAVQIDRIILGAISGYRHEYEHLKSTFSLTNGKPMSYQYLSLKFTSDIWELLNGATDLLDNEITQWSQLLNNYHGAFEKRSTESKLKRVFKEQVAGTDETEKKKFLAECRARPEAKTLFTPIRERLTARYRNELVFIPITIESRSFDRTQWKEDRARFMGEFQDQFKDLNSDYLNHPNRVAERKELFERPTTDSGEMTVSSKSHDLWDYSAPDGDDRPYTEGDLWNSEQAISTFYIKKVNELNDYALDEFAAARHHHNLNKE